MDGKRINSDKNKNKQMCTGSMVTNNEIDEEWRDNLNKQGKYIVVLYYTISYTNWNEISGSVKNFS